MTSSRTEPRVLVDVEMPQMGVSVAEGTITEWKLAVGDPVLAEETICEITTDKIDTELPAPASGVVAEIVVPVGETVAVGTVLARIATSGEVVADAEPAPGAARYSPVVSRIAAEHGIDLSGVIGTGRNGRVRKQDVLALIRAEEPPMHIESPYIPEETGSTLSHMRRQIGAHMKRSLETAATCTTWMECDMSRVEAARRQARVGDLIGITALPIVARATIAALRDFPALNATLDGDRYEQHRAVHLGVAVSLGREGGLIVPVIRDAHELSAEGLAARIKDVAQRARANRLKPDEVHGGTFTITNPGQYGAIMATPVINQPQVAILDLEAIVKRPIVVSDDDGNDMISIRPQTILGLSWDHRALDGALAAQFLAAIRRRLESWER